MHNFLSNALLRAQTFTQPATSQSTFQPLTFAIGLSVPIWWGCWAKMVARDGAREVPSCWWQECGAGTSSAKVGKPGETTTVSVRWQLLLTLGIACHLASCSRLLDLVPTSPMESRALAFRQGRALSAHYSRCWWPGKGWTDVGRDLGSNKSLDHNNAAPELLLRCLTDVGAPRLRLDGKTTHTVPSFLLL